MTRKVGLYLRGQVYWCRVKNEHGKWVNRNTRYKVGQEDLAQRYADALQRSFDQLRDDAPSTANKCIDVVARVAEAFAQTGEDSDTKENPWRAGPHGYIYAVQLLPELFPQRIKIGHTTMTVASRLHNYRTSCPDALVLAFWAGSRDREQAVLRALDGRIRRSEVFDCEDVDGVLSHLDRMLGRRLGGTTTFASVPT